MATPVNDRDVLIMGTTPRYTPPTDRGMLLTPPAAVFKLSADGVTASPSSFQFVATLLNMTGTVTWSTSGGISLSVNGNTATLNFASFSAVSGTITATITVDGQQFTQIATVTKLADGAAGPQGSRGNVDISAVTSGSVWSDSEAAAALAAAGYGAPQVRDLVNLYRADRTFSAQRMYNGSAWIAVDYVWNGNVFVKGSILPEAIDSRGLTIRDAAGNIILNAGTSLANQVATNPNLVARISSWKGYRGNGAWPYIDTGVVLPGNVLNPVNGEFIVLPKYSGTLSEFHSDVVPILPGQWYTVSFYAWCQGNPSNLGGSISCDMYGGNVDSVGINPSLPANSAAFFTFTEQMPANATGAQWLRFFSGDSNNQWLIWSVKVELGKKQTAWSDDIITSANVSTFIQAASILLAQINTASIGSLSALTAVIGLLRTATSGARTEIGDNVIKMFADNNQKTFHLGDSTK